MVVAVSEIRFAGQSMAEGVHVGPQWHYAVRLTVQPLDAYGQTISGAGMQLLRLAGWRGDYETTLCYPAGDNGAEPSIHEVGTDAMQWVLSTIHSLRQTWNGHEVILTGRVGD